GTRLYAETDCWIIQQSFGSGDCLSQNREIVDPKSPSGRKCASANAIARRTGECIDSYGNRRLIVDFRDTAQVDRRCREHRVSDESGCDGREVGSVDAVQDSKTCRSGPGALIVERDGYL